MKRRDLSAALLFGTGVALSTNRAQAQSCVAPCYPQTAAEFAAGINPTNTGYPPGNVLRYGANGSDAADDSASFASALACNSEIFIPDGTYYLRKVSFGAAGKIIRGQSRYNTILRPASGLLAGEPLFYFSGRAIGTTYGNLVENLRFQLHRGSGNVDCVGIDLGSVNNTVIRSCRFEGFSKAGALADGVVFDAPLSGGAYSNSVIECDFTGCENGVRFEGGANNNYVNGGEFVSCVVGINAAPSSGTLDTPKIFGPRIEGCDIGLKERAVQGMYFGIRFEANAVDVDFLPGSTEPQFFGGLTASSPVCFQGAANASGLVCVAPDLSGVTLRSNSASRAHEFVGPNVFAPLGNTGALANPPGSGAFAAYFRGGRVVLDNSQWVVARNAAGTGVVFTINVNSSDVVEVGASGKVDIGNTAAADRTRVFKPSFLFSGTGTSGSVVNKFAVYNASGTLVGYVPVFSS